MWRRLRRNRWFVLIAGTVLGLPIAAMIAALTTIVAIMFAALAVRACSQAGL